ncbi:MAG: pantetheine-phosphate adenylyltransferase [Bacteroidales bacterium]
MNVALFPGSFDPFTIGHASIVERALPLFDRIVIGIGTNTSKSGFFPAEARVEMIQALYGANPKVEAIAYSDLTVTFCRKINARYMLRGLRTALDFEYERSIALVNQVMLPEVETVFMLTLPEHSAINSSLVREILKYGGDVSKFVPEAMMIDRYINTENDRTDIG